MTDAKVHVALYFAFSFYDYARFEHAWQALQAPIMPRLRYARCQPYKYAVSSDTRAAFDLFSKDNALMFGNRDRSLTGILDTTMQGYSRLSVFLARSLWSEGWMGWVMAQCAAPVLFGRACALAEHAAKHGTRREFPEGTARGQIGAGEHGLYRFLPGIYWFTVLGKELVAALDIEVVRGFAGVRLHELPGNQLALRLEGEPFVDGDTLAARLARETQIASALGDDYFFDRDRLDRELRPVPAFLAALESLRPASGHPRRG